MKRTINITELAEYGSRSYFAEALGVNKITLLRAERKGLLKAAGVNKREIYYTKAEIKKYLGAV
jgi:predicted site-specific integrase-resolvase